MAFNIRKFAFRVQMRPASKTKGRRVSLVSAKKLTKPNSLKGEKEKGAVKKRG